MLPLAQLAPKTFWNAEAGSSELYMKIGIALILGIASIFALMAAPAQVRRPIVVAVTFLSGLFYVLFWIFPSPIDRQPDEMPQGLKEGVSFWLADAQPVVAQLTNIIAAFLIGLGIYSLLRVHLRKFLKFQKDWFFSGTLVTSLVAMVVFGYWDYMNRQGADGANLSLGVGWGPAQYGKDILFDGLLQQMDAGMFSIVAFYILSAAYRAFRARSAEATILLTTALILMLSLLGALTLAWNNGVTQLGQSIAPNSPMTNPVPILAILFLLVGGFTAYLAVKVRLQAAIVPGVFSFIFLGLLLVAIMTRSGSIGAADGAEIVNNLKLTEIAGWIRNTLQTPSIRGIEFGVGIGLLAMGLRVWLSLEKTGGNI